MAVSLEDQKKICSCYSSLLWICQRLHVEVRKTNLVSEINHFSHFIRVNLSIAVVAMTSNKTRVLRNGTEANVSDNFVNYFRG